MDAEERRRTMDFILQQRSQFDARLARLAENDAKADTRLTRLENVLRGAIRAGLRERREWRERYAALVGAQIRNEDEIRDLKEAQQRGSAGFEALREAQQRTGASIDALRDATQHNSEGIEALRDATRRNTEGIESLREVTRRNSEDIGRLARIVARTTRRNGGGGDTDKDDEVEP